MDDNKKIKVAINGFGRIGRLSLRALLQKSCIEIVAINDLTDPFTLAHLLKYDSTHGRFPGTVYVQDNQLVIADGRSTHSIAVFSLADPTELPWGRLHVDVVLESTGRFLDAASAGKHLAAGAKRVVLSAPAKDQIPTVVLGVNDYILQENPPILSNASCTTNCLAPMAKVLDENFGIEQGYINTIHAYTADQSLQDSPHKDLRRARAATQSIIPTTTGAAKAVGLVLPHLKGKLDGISMRVPVINGSVTDLTVLLKMPVTALAINQAMKQASETSLHGILAYTNDPIVSADVIGDTHSCIFDSQLTAANGYLAKVVGWYDNEFGYAQRIADLIEKLA
jgi:glyceraldehyde 3-phosphate dehydrogenase